MVDRRPLSGSQAALPLTRIRVLGSKGRSKSTRSDEDATQADRRAGGGADGRLQRHRAGGGPPVRPQGAKVVVSARGEDGLNSLVEEIRDEGGEATTAIADTSEFDQVKAVAEHAAEEYGTLDTWVHLAAVGLFATFEETTPEEFARVVDVNLMGQ